MQSGRQVSQLLLYSLSKCGLVMPFRQEGELENTGTFHFKVQSNI